MNAPTTIDLVLVEDNPQDLALALLALDEHFPSGRVHVARDGAEALAFIFCEGDYADRTISETPKVILLDLKLPKFGGIEVLRRIRADWRTKHIPVVMLTSSKEQCDVIQSYQLGVNSYIVKPVNFERFTEAVRNFAFYWHRLNQPVGPPDCEQSSKHPFL
jgi:two-component system, response regulator